VFAMRASTWVASALVWGLGAGLGLVVPDTAARAGSDDPTPRSKVIATGRTLFQREWKPNDIRCHNGDGLGPVYNEVSCVACHNLGGSGGGGSNRKNAEIVTSLATPEFRRDAKALPPPDLMQTVRSQTGLRTTTGAVLHKFGTSPDYQDWRDWLLHDTTFDKFTSASPSGTRPRCLARG